MNNLPNANINNTFQKPLKLPFNVGSNIVVIIDKTIAQKLGINENDTLLEQEITNDGILMRIRKIDKNLVII